jgi:hypothetical protein
MHRSSEGSNRRPPGRQAVRSAHSATTIWQQCSWFAENRFSFATLRAYRSISTAAQGEAGVKATTACAHRTGRASRVSTARGSEWAHPTREKVPDIRSRSCEDGGRLAPQFKTTQKPLHVRRRLPEPIVIPEPPFAFVGLMGVARATARAIAATAEGGPLRLRVNPALHTRLSGVGSRQNPSFGPRVPKTGTAKIQCISDSI